MWWFEMKCCGLMGWKSNQPQSPWRPGSRIWPSSSRRCAHSICSCERCKSSHAGSPLSRVALPPATSAGSRIFLAPWGQRQLSFVDIGVIRHIAIDGNDRRDDLRALERMGEKRLDKLLAAHFHRFKYTRKKIGSFMTHARLIFMLMFQMVTDKYQVESNLRLEEGQTKGYSISGNECELVIIDKSQPNTDTVAAIPAEVLRKNKTYPTGSLPFEVTVLDYFTNSDLVQLGQGQPNKATRGKGLELTTIDKESVTSLEEVNFPGAYIKLQSTDGTELGIWMVSALFGALRQPIPEQTLEHGGKEYELALRFKRYYTPYDIKLIDFKHDKFQGTEKARNFSSLVILRDRATGAEREVNIWMNHPLRTHGKTYFQASFDPENDRATVLQVVRNPGWVTPYISCALVGLGLLIQFLTHLFSFNRKRKAAV